MAKTHPLAESPAALPTERSAAARFRKTRIAHSAALSEDYAERTLRSIINLGRYGELFAYDDESQTFSYENPQ